MKKLFLIIIVVMMAINFAAAATEYVLVKEGEKITIYNLSSDLNRTWITSSSLMNPTISQLRYSDLPEDLWKLTNAKDGIYDTRLQKMEQQKEDLEEEIALLKDDYARATGKAERGETKFEFLFIVSAALSLIIVILTLKIKRLEKTEA
ncbi:MAG: hypothetical protein WCK59_02030 [Candidatus Falkowbacteria bacterium]